MEGSAAGCSFEQEEAKSFGQEAVARALAQLSCHADVRHKALFQ
jgi:hypothetical protein